ncbi:CLUMA_CG014134, isoform A [Clunio marinus]|uniref:CLUMA_CG014134, isoform A n=1 Tax=Clunio marinus TaxID=568069 RepID=A0A1J1IKZ0_9DIPT|nr:CLUMA_CG014134, isoform A [Clunio marinus]
MLGQIREARKRKSFTAFACLFNSPVSALESETNEWKSTEISIPSEQETNTSQYEKLLVMLILFHPFLILALCVHDVVSHPLSSETSRTFSLIYLKMEDVFWLEKKKKKKIKSGANNTETDMNI